MNERRVFKDPQTSEQRPRQKRPCYAVSVEWLVNAVANCSRAQISGSPEDAFITSVMGVKDRLAGMRLAIPASHPTSTKFHTI